MIKTKWILSCLVALGTLMTASAQAQNFATTINTTRFGSAQGTYNVTLTQGPANTFAVSVVQTSPASSIAFVDALSFAFVDAAFNPLTIASASGSTKGPGLGGLTFPFLATPLPDSSVALSDNVGGTPGPNADTPIPPFSTSLNSFNTYSGTITLAPGSNARGVTIGLTGNGGSGNNFATNVVPESNASILLLAALLPIGMLVARRRTSKSAV